MSDATKIRVICFVEGGVVTGARSNCSRVSFDVADSDNLDDAEGGEDETELQHLDDEYTELPFAIY